MWFDGRLEQRIVAWRKFRNGLSIWPDDLERVAAAWAKAPIRNYLTQDEEDKWPDPWQLISDNIYCDIAVALGIFYTLHFSSYPQKQGLRMVGYRLRSSHKEVNLVLCEGDKYVLNYELGRIVNIPDFLHSEKPTYNYASKDLLD
jgi:hypothetical protein